MTPRARKVQRAMALLLDPAAIRAWLSWPLFSLTSFTMVSQLQQQGIRPGTVIDVGANVGQFAVAALKTFGPELSVYCFEPLPECVKQLKANLHDSGKVQVYPIAIGEREGTTSFLINSHDHSSSILSLAKAHREAFPEAREIGTITVEVKTLDNVLRNENLKPPVLLKIDVQGFEAQTILGARDTLKRVDYAVIETSFRPMYEGEPTFVGLLSIMEKLNFEFQRPVGWLDDPHTGEVLQADALFKRVPANL